MNTALLNYWNNLNERERWMAAIGSLCVLLYLFYLLLYSPLASSVQTRSKQLLEKKETLAWMQQVRQQPRNQKSVQVISNAKLLALIGNQLTANNFRQFTYQVQQTGTGDIQLSFDRVPYNQFLSWLWSLANDYSITLKQFIIERTDTPGIVKVMLVITAR